MKTGTRKLLSCAALAAGTILTGTAAAHESDQAEATRRAQQAARETARRAAQATQSLLATHDEAASLRGAACRIGNGKSALYTEGLYSCLTALAGGEYVIFVPRLEERP